MLSKPEVVMKTGQDGAILPARDTGFAPQVHRWCFSVLFHIINPLLTKLAPSGRLDIGLVLFFCLFTDVNRQKKKLGQYPPILTSRLVNNPYMKVCYLDTNVKNILPASNSRCPHFQFAKMAKRTPWNEKDNSNTTHKSPNSNS